MEQRWLKTLNNFYPVNSEVNWKYLPQHTVDTKIQKGTGQTEESENELAGTLRPL